MAIDVEKYTQSAVGAQALRAEIKRCDDAGLPLPSEQKMREIADHADALNCFGFDAKQDRNGNWQQQGVGAWPHKVTMNSLAAVRRYEGQASFEKMVRRLWKEAPDRARAIGAPELPRLAGA